jgi:DNA-binding IclR family transcriptional regulator
MAQSVDRALEILSLVSEQPQTLKTLSDHLEVHKSTALRLAQSLERAGLVSRRSDGAYTIGRQLLSIAATALASLDIRDVARPHLAALNRSFSHTVHLASLVGNEVVYVDKFEGTAKIQMYSRIGRTTPLHASGVGKVILAYRSESELAQLLKGLEYQQYAPDTITSEAELRRDLELIRERGYAVDRGEFETLIHCVAAPVRGIDGTVTSAMSMSVPKMLLDFDGLMALVPELVATADAISRDYGWKPR